MPLDRFVLLIIVVLAAAAATIWIGAVLLTGWQVSPVAALAVAIPTGLVAYIIARVIADRLGNREDDHYDRIEK